MGATKRIHLQKEEDYLYGSDDLSTGLDSYVALGQETNRQIDIFSSKLNSISGVEGTCKNYKLSFEGLDSYKLKLRSDGTVKEIMFKAKVLGKEEKHKIHIEKYDIHDIDSVIVSAIQKKVAVGYDRVLGINYYNKFKSELHGIKLGEFARKVIAGFHSN